MVTNTNVPAHIAARVAARATEGKKSGITGALLSESFSYPKISTKASRYRLMEDGVETVVGVTLDVVIVGANPRVSKIWYNKAYDGVDVSAPDCFSNDGITPDESVEKPFHSNCAACPNNVLGSKVTPSGAKSKICADQRHLAVVPAADPTKVYGLTVPVSGMKALREYIKDLNNYGLIPEEVITELGFDDSASYPKITFKQKGFVPEKAIKGIEVVVTADDTLVVTRQLTGNAQARLSFKSATVEQPKPQPVKTEKPKPAKPTPVVEDEETDTNSLSSMEAKLDALFAE